jgi:serine/threonine protein kinase
MKQLLEGYLDVYKCGIVHRDLKPANLFFKKGVLKLADFGFAIK